MQLFAYCRHSARLISILALCVCSIAATPSGEGDDVRTVFATIRKSYYQGGLQPRPDNGELVRMQEFYVKHPDDPEAQFWAGYLEARGLLKSNLKPIELFRSAMEKGQTGAMSLLGGAYLKGDGVDVDFQRGKQLLDEATAKGESDAAMQYARAYWYGARGVEKNAELAEKFARKAIEMGDNRAHFLLAQIDERIKHDSRDMIVELTAGAEGGDSDAIVSARRRLRARQGRSH